MWQREVILCKVSDGTRVVGKCLRNFLIRCFRSDYVWDWRNIPQTVRKKYTTFTTEQIVALRSVNKIFPESYDFAATQLPIPNRPKPQTNRTCRGGSVKARLPTPLHVVGEDHLPGVFRQPRGANTKPTPWISSQGAVITPSAGGGAPPASHIQPKLS
jgi:hypothetical protein